MVSRPLAVLALGVLLASGPRVAAQEAITIHGRFLDSAGAPLAGVRASLAQEEPQPDGGWIGPSLLSRKDGTFSFRFFAPEGIPLRLRAHREDLAPASWRLLRLPAGSDLDLGDVELQACGDLVVRLVDENGRPLVGPWMVGVFPAVAWQPPRQAMESRRIHIDPKTGTFRFASLPAREMKLEATAQMWLKVDGPVVQVRAGETVEVTVESNARNTVGGIRLVATCAQGEVRSLAGLRLLGPDGKERAATERFGPRRPTIFTDLAPGRYTLEVTDPRFAPWRREGVRPGEEVRAELVGTAALKMNVFDAEGEERLTGYHLEVVAEDGGIGPRWGDGARMWDQPPFDGVFPGIVPGDLEVTVGVASGTREVVRVPAVAPGETREVDVWMREDPLVVGVVRDLNGRPVHRARVELLEPARVDDSPSSKVHLARRGEARDRDDRERLRQHQGTDLTDEEGAFAFRQLPPGDYLVRAEIEGMPPVESDVFTLTRRNTVDDLVLVVEIRSALLTVHLDWPPDVDLDAITEDNVLVVSGHVYERREKEDEGPIDFLLSDETWVYTGESEPLVLGPLPAGEITVKLKLSTGYQRADGSWATGRRGIRTLGTVDASAGGEFEATFSVADVVPGHVSVQLREDATFLSDCEVHVLGLGSAAGEARVATTDADGFARVGPLFPGEWVVLVRDRQRGWDHMVPDPLLLPPGGDIPLEVVVHPVAGEVTCLFEGTDEPWKNTVFELRPVVPREVEHDYPRWTRVRTDAKGRLELTLLPGAYVMRRIDPRAVGGMKTRMVIFGWTLSGAEVPSLRLQ